MDNDQFLFWTVCLGSIFLARVISNYLFPEPSEFLEAYGGCNCGRDECEKIDELNHRGKRYRRIDIQEYKMTYKYFKIYNVTQGKYAFDVSGEDDPNTIWESNDWNENDALVGYFRDDNDVEIYQVIFCRPGYAIYIQSEDEKDRDTYKVDNKEYRIPPAMLVNLNNAYDSDFLHSKNYPSDEDMSDNESDTESETDEDYKACNKANQPVINFLRRCRAATENVYKKRAYDNAINEVKEYWNPINNGKNWNPCTIGSSIERKIKEFLMGISEDEIINS
jgi:hypothetical protein